MNPAWFTAYQNKTLGGYLNNAYPIGSSWIAGVDKVKVKGYEAVCGQSDVLVIRCENEQGEDVYFNKKIFLLSFV